jgi:hypothetical protein
LAERKIRLLVAIFPPAYYKKGNNPYFDKGLSHIHFLCKKYNVANLDMTQVTISMLQKHKSLCASPYDAHPNKILHKAYAEELNKYLKANL